MNKTRIFLLLLFFSGSILPISVAAQPRLDIDEFFDTLVRSVREDEVGCSIIPPGITRTGVCFGEEADTTADALADGLNLLISDAFARLPEVSTISLYEYTSHGGQLTRQRQFLGPLFTETSETIGRGLFDLGFNYARYSFSKIRNVGLDNLEFTLAPPDLSNPGSDISRGNTFFERETLVVRMNFQADASIFAFTGVYGLLDELDVGLTVPFILLDTKLDAEATLSNNVGIPAIYYFNDNPLNPQLERTYDSFGSTTFGVGDVSLRFKWHLNKQPRKIRNSVLLHLKGPLPFLDTELPLSSETWNIRALYLIDKPGNRYSFFGNLGLDWRQNIRNDLFVALNAGLNIKLQPSVDLLIEALGELDVPIGDAQPIDELTNLLDVEFAENVFLRSNITESTPDHSLLGAVGVKYANLRFSAYANVLVPLVSQWGLSFASVPRIGINMNLGAPAKE